MPDFVDMIAVQAVFLPRCLYVEREFFGSETNGLCFLLRDLHSNAVEIRFFVFL
jgi:hypothetical protein